MSSKAIIAILAGGAFLYHALVAWRLADLEVFEQYNVLFNADANIRLFNIAHGYLSEFKTHPLFHVFFSVPIRLVAGLLAPIIDVDAIAIREQLALLVVPALSAVRAAVVFVLARALGMPTSRAVWIAVLGLAMFSHALFGGIPEHAGVTGSLMALTYLLFAKGAMVPGRRALVAWFVLGLLLVGVTSTNLMVLFFWLFAVFVGARCRPMAAGVKSAALCALVVVLVFGTGKLWDESFGLADTSYPPGEHVVSESGAALDRLSRVPTALADTVVAFAPVLTENELGRRNASKYDVQLSYRHRERGAADVALAIALLVVLVSGARIGSRSDPRVARMTGVSVAIILAHVVLFTVFGGPELILYSQQWAFPVLFLVGLSLNEVMRRGRVGSVVSTAIIVGIAIINLLTIEGILTRLGELSE